MSERERRIRYEVSDGAAWIEIHRPEKLNALDRATVEELGAAVERAEADPGVRVVVITGAGEKAFVAGADIAEMASLDARGGQDFSYFLHEVFGRIERCAKPVVAAVNGFALGGGCELALACHVRIAAPGASFGQPEVSLGLIPGAGGTQRLPRLVGRGKALDLLLTGDRIDAEEARRIGLVDRIAPEGELRAFVASWVARVRAKSPLAIARVLEAVASGSESPLREGLRLESALFGIGFASEDFREGTKAFLEKRSADFQGR